MPLGMAGLPDSSGMEWSTVAVDAIDGAYNYCRIAAKEGKQAR